MADDFLLVPMRTEALVAGQSALIADKTPNFYNLTAISALPSAVVNQTFAVKDIQPGRASALAWSHAELPCTC